MPESGLSVAGKWDESYRNLGCALPESRALPESGRRRPTAGDRRSESVLLQVCRTERYVSFVSRFVSFVSFRVVPVDALKEIKKWFCVLFSPRSARGVFRASVG